jgi:hypothetical protein
MNERESEANGGGVYWESRECWNEGVGIFIYGRTVERKRKERMKKMGVI